MKNDCNESDSFEILKNQFMLSQVISFQIEPQDINFKQITYKLKQCSSCRTQQIYL